MRLFSIESEFGTTELIIFAFTTLNLDLTTAGLQV